MRNVLSGLCRRLARDRRGMVAVLFALSALPMMTMIGIAIEYAHVTGSRARLGAMADSAAVIAVSEQVLKPAMTPDEQVQAARQAMEREFAGQIEGLSGSWRLTKTSYNAEPIDQSLQVSLCYEASLETLFGAITGLAALDFGGCATARSAPPIYVSVYALVDASGSMGIGATYSDQDLMTRRLGCVFACHTIRDVDDSICDQPAQSIPHTWFNQTTKCVELIGARTRFDVVRDALIRVTEQAERLTRVPNQYRLSIHQFSNYLTEIHPLSTSMSQARGAIRDMRMDKRGGGSNFYKVLADFTRLIPEGGDGRSPDSPKVFVMLLTDGIGGRVFHETRCWFGKSPPCVYEGGWRQDRDYVLEEPFVDTSIRSQAFPGRLCDGLKARKATVLTLVTEYDSSRINDSRLKNIDRTLRPLATQGLEGCASDVNLAYQANHGPDVESAINQMFAAVVEKARLVR